MSSTIRNFVSAIFYQLGRALPEILLHLVKRVVVKRLRLKKKSRGLQMWNVWMLWDQPIEKGYLVSPWTWIRFTFNTDELFCHDTSASLSAEDTVLCSWFLLRDKTEGNFLHSWTEKKACIWTSSWQGLHKVLGSVLVDSPALLPHIHTNQHRRSTWGIAGVKH